MPFKSPIILLISSFLLFMPGTESQAADQIRFWDTPRKGANYFNLAPEEQWFRSASSLGIQWVRLAYAKWKGKHRDFLMGDADNYTGIVKPDLAKLKQALDWAGKYRLKVVITPLGLPGCRWAQKNGGRRDLRLWKDKTYWKQAAAFWRSLALALKDHPAVCAYNILNEPTPEMKTGLAEHGPASRYHDWYKKHQGTTRDLPAFYTEVIAAIREVDPDTPIMLDSGWYAQPAAFVHWPKLDDDKLLYAFHMYEPYAFTNHRNFKNKKKLSYPGKIPYAGRKINWDKAQIKSYFAPYFNWAKSRGIPKNRLVGSEFGCYRRNPGCREYLKDVISLLNSHKLHWAIYSFREDEWDGYDYEVGTKGLGWKYWKAKDAGENPKVPRKDNPLFQVIKNQFQPK
jgi:hypothetical protein